MYITYMYTLWHTCIIDGSLAAQTNIFFILGNVKEKSGLGSDTILILQTEQKKTVKDQIITGICRKVQFLRLKLVDQHRLADV